MKRSTAALLCCCALATPAFAEEPGTGFWGGVDGGAASLHRSRSATGSSSGTNFAMAFRGGYAWHPQLLLGAEIGGWLLQAGDYNDRDPSRGEGIQALLGYAQYYPSVESPYFVKAGLGRATYWTNHAGESGGSGPAAMLGAGRDFALSGRWSVTAAVDYSWGRLNAITSPPGITQDERYRALTLRIGLTYR